MNEANIGEFSVPSEFETQTPPGVFVMLFRYHKENFWSKKKLQILL